jgi:hypothetical protein
MPVGNIVMHRNRHRTAWLAIMVALAAGGSAAPFLTAGNPWLQAIGAAWLGYWVHVVCGLLERMVERDPILIIDDIGIRDTRLLARSIEWGEIERIYPVDLARNQVVELQLRHPHRTLAGARWHMRLGLDWHRPLDLPEVCINLVLLDGTVADVMGAIERRAPHLLPRRNFVPHWTPSWSR